MKLEDIKVDLTKQEVDPKTWNIDQWRKDNPIDYFKIFAILMQADNDFLMLERMKAVYQITRYYLPDTLYKYYSLTDDEELNRLKIETLADGKIFMANAVDFNDPFDGKGFYYNAKELSEIDPLKDYEGRIIDDFSSFSKCTSLTSNGIHSLPMWAHYASNHKGFCVSYDMGDEDNITLIGNTFPVQYISERVDVTGFMRDYVAKLIATASKQAMEGRRDILITDSSIIYMTILFGNLKHETWSYEHEFRCSTASNASGMPYIKAKPKELFVGMNCTDDNCKKLEELANTRGIPAFKMCFNETNDVYGLATQRLNK